MDNEFGVKAGLFRNLFLPNSLFLFYIPYYAPRIALSYQIKPRKPLT